jgi:hypothetical protein
VSDKNRPREDADVLVGGRTPLLAGVTVWAAHPVRIPLHGEDAEVEALPIAGLPAVAADGGKQVPVMYFRDVYTGSHEHFSWR